MIARKEFAEFKKLFANQLRAVRGTSTQVQLALLTKFSQQMISRYESGRVPKVVWFLRGLAAAGIDVNKLLLGMKQKPLNQKRYISVLRKRGHWK